MSRKRLSYRIDFDEPISKTYLKAVLAGAKKIKRKMPKIRAVYR